MVNNVYIDEGETQPYAELRATIRANIQTHDWHGLARAVAGVPLYRLEAAIALDYDPALDNENLGQVLPEVLAYLGRLWKLMDDKHQEIQKLKHPNVVPSRGDASDIPF